jgi:hypothetical protein
MSFVTNAAKGTADSSLKGQPHEDSKELCPPLHAQTDVKQAFLEYRYWAAVRGGSLLVRPLSQRQLAATTDLLTQSFSEAIGYFSVYRC